MAVAYVGGDAVGTLGADAVVADGPSTLVQGLVRRRCWLNGR
jgi:hypothetical protein